MRGQYPGGMHRREFIGAATLAAAGAAISSAQEHISGSELLTKHRSETLGVPGPYPGRVVEVRNPAMIRSGKKDRTAIQTSLNRGLTALTGTDHPVEAWRNFVQPGEAVGIKVVPNGYPGAQTSYELVLEVIDGLKAAGINLKDMVVFDRYGVDFHEARYHEILPAGVANGALTPAGWDASQLEIEFDVKDPIAGYDPDEHVRLPLVGRGQDPKDDRCFRSHLGRIVTKRLDKIILLPCVKDHHAAGATGALKNMSHGLVNNVFRSHSAPDSIAMVAFIPAVVSHPIIRQKCVLHIMDGIRGVWEYGPYGKNPEWLFEYNALLFATDPVAMDHIEWDILDAQRKKVGVPGVGAVGRLAVDPFKHEGYDIRQPQYITVAGQIGLGNFDFKSPRGRRYGVDHRVLNIS
jgi:Domain of unknown function (DUF362)